ncbi:MAG: Ig-like domain-containing protein, partial [Bacteroidota bacterium]|nr:Ig-like domain-containing protein [Bacteroidota bacterium]
MKKYLPFQILIFVLFIISCSSDSGDPEPEPEPDVIAPTVTVQIAGSSNNSTGEPSVFSNQITIDISAQDAGGVAKVEAFINDQKVGEDNSAPFQLTIDLSNYSSKIPSTGKFQDYILKI